MDFFTFIWCKKCNVFLEKTKVNKEEAEDAYFFEKNDCLVYRNGSSLSLPLTAVALLAVLYGLQNRKCLKTLGLP